MDAALVLCNSLIKWLQSLQVKGSQKNGTEISDGVAVANALVQISPEYFNTAWNNKIKTDVKSNWRLKVSNLKKIVEGIIEYYQDVLNLNVLEGAKPDVYRIGEHADPIELGKLLQLVLGCAVNCEKKQEYITHIMAMEESVQQCIMHAIQSLEEATQGGGPFSLNIVGSIDSNSSRIHKLAADLEVADEARELLAQQCHELQRQVSCLTEEKQMLNTEVHKLQEQIDRIDGCGSIGEESTARTVELRRQIESLKEELYKMETSRDDYRIKAYESEKQTATLQSRIDDLQVAADRAIQLKDEVDALTEKAAKAETMELTLSSYKKKLEEYADLKKQIKVLEDKNNEYYQQILSYEEDSKKSVVLKTQIDMYKKKLTELHQRLDEESQKVDKMEFENKKLEAKLSVITREKETVVAEREALKETNEELRCINNTSVGGQDVAGELATPDLRERVAILEKENRELRLASSDPAAAALLEDATQRQEQLRGQLRTSNQRILELETKLEEKQDTELRQQILNLQETLTAKETELQANAEKYKKNIEKARDIIKSMQPRGGSLGEETIARTTPSDCMKENEERLITTAFYNLASQCQRDAVNARLALLSAGQSATFLSRQRQPVSRHSLQSYKLK